MWKQCFSIALVFSLLSQVAFARPRKPEEVQAKKKAVVAAVAPKTKAVVAAIAPKAEQISKPTAKKPKLSGGVSMDYIEDAIKTAALKVNVPHDLLRAICRAESNLKPDAFVFNDGGDQNHSFGMCQVLHETAKTIIDVSPGCAQDFRDPALVKSAKTCNLFGPKTNALVAATYLKAQIERYKGDLVKATASYNSGSYKLCSSGVVKNRCGKELYRCVPGDILNRHYVNRVGDFMDDGSMLCSLEERQKSRSIYEAKTINVNRSFAKGQI